ncbi:MAG: DUF3375 domain-containing protein, partial [Kineosporiaceae bacterium]
MSDYDALEALSRRHPAWRLLRADSAPLVLAFLGQVFVEENVRSISAGDLVRRLDDVLYDLNARLGEGTFPRPAREYLETWAGAEAGWLRKYYPTSSDEPWFDATPAVEKAWQWVGALQARSFVGTQSRLNTVVELLRQMAFGSQADPEVRLAELRRRRAEIDAEIALVEAGHVPVLDRAELRDRYQQFAATSRELLADFREVETNVRSLDRDLRSRIAGWSGSKGELLDDVVGSRRTIGESDQGRNFHAFYDFLLSRGRQEEFSALLEAVQGLPELGEADPRLRYIHHDWLEACERTQGTVRQLSDQLRRFLDDQVWLENRRVVTLLRSIERTALRLGERERAPAVGTTMADTRMHVVLPMERPLYSPPRRVLIESDGIEAAEEDLDTGLLDAQIHVDAQRLTETVRATLRSRDQVGLDEVVAAHPIEQGLAELVGYLAATDPMYDVVFDQTERRDIGWAEEDGVERVADVPAVTFSRARA